MRSLLLKAAVAWVSLAPQALGGWLPHLPVRHDKLQPHIFPLYDASAHAAVVRRAAAGSLLAQASQADLRAAQSVVDKTIAQMAVRNAARIAHPARTPFQLRQKQVFRGNLTARDKADAPPPLVKITDEMARAAALMAELWAATGSLSVAGTGNSTHLNGTTTPFSQPQKRGPTFWMQNIARKGTVPWGGDSRYKVFRNVVDYGADPSGARDSTQAFNKAMEEGNRCGKGCFGSTTKNAIVYVPPGKYLISSTVEVLFGTQFIGDANNWPTLVAAPSFSGLGVISTDHYIGGIGPDGKDAEFYVNTASFYRQIRNIRIDVTSATDLADIAGIHYQVAQATSLQNVEITAKKGSKQQGIFSENGSGGVMSDVTIRGGKYGYYGGNQQFSTQRMNFINCDTAIRLIWDWGFVWKSLRIEGGNVGIGAFPDVDEDGVELGGHIGSISLVDSEIIGVKKAIVIAPPVNKPLSGSSGIALDNVYLTAGVFDTGGKELIGAGSYTNVFLGPRYQDNKRSWVTSMMVWYPREKSLQGRTNGLSLPELPYLERRREQYEDKGPGDFVHLKDLGAKGDGSWDDTAAVQAAMRKYGDGSKIIFVDAGTYMLSDTVIIGKDAKIVGETWSQFAAFGPKFSDPMAPRPMLRVGGTSGEEGTVEMQDLMLTTKGGTAGVVLLEWNVKAKTPGSAALWDVHARVGGATGTNLTPAECPVSQGNSPKKECQAASMLMHITKGASGLFDNMWLWVADHLTDDPQLQDEYNEMPQLSVYVARGLLIESKAPVWLYGTSSEHSTLYQYNFHKAQNVYTTFIQTESPYYQPTPTPPAPWGNTLGKFPGDPTYKCGNDFDGCDESWAVILNRTQNINIGSAGTYSFFRTYSLDCVNQNTCQKALWLMTENYDRVRVQNMITIGSKYMFVADGKGVPVSENQAVMGNPKEVSWGQVSLVDVPTHGSAPFDWGDDDDWGYTDFEPCDITLDFKSLEELNDKKGTLKPHCWARHALDTLLYILEDAKTKYESAKDGYDSKFGTYSRLYRQQVSSQLEKCFSWSPHSPKNEDKAGPCNQFFSCVYQTGTWNSTVTPCPPPEVDPGAKGEFHLYYMLKDEAGFYKYLAATYGIEKDWVKFDWFYEINHRDCKQHIGDPHETCQGRYDVRHNWATAKGDMKPPSPKEIFEKTGGGISNLQTSIIATSLELALGQWIGSAEEAVDTLAPAVFMVSQAVDSMNDIKDLATEVEEKERINLILTIVGAAVMLIPIVGQIGGALTSVAQIARIGLMLGLTADIAITALSIINDPDSAVAVLIGMAAGLNGVGRSPKTYRAGSAARRALDRKTLDGFGATFKKHNDVLEKIVPVKQVCKIGKRDEYTAAAAGGLTLTPVDYNVTLAL